MTVCSIRKQSSHVLCENGCGDGSRDTRAIDESCAPEPRPGKAIVVVITYGEENSSREYTYPRVNEMICHQRDVYKWEFMFVGTNQDAIASAAMIGIDAKNALTYGRSGHATRAAYGVVAESLSARRAGLSGHFTDDAREAALAGEPDEWTKKPSSRPGSS